MTNDQNQCCYTAAISPTREAARLVLVEGVSQDEAISRTGVAMQTLRNALVRIRKYDAQIRAAYLTTPTPP